jgi:hypothetical protein
MLTDVSNVVETKSRPNGPHDTSLFRSGVIRQAVSTKLPSISPEGDRS